MNFSEESVTDLNSANAKSLNITIPKTSLRDDDNQVSPTLNNNKTSNHQPEGSPATKRGGNKRGRNPKDALTPQAPGREGSGWECSICTFRNSAKTFSCEICSTRKGTSTRKPRLNSNLIAQQALAAVDKGPNTPAPALTVTPPTTASTAASTPPPDSIKPLASPVVTSKKSKANPRKGTGKLKPGPKAKVKPAAVPENLEDVDCNFKKNLDLAADTLLLLSSSSPTPHRPLKKRPTLKPPSPPPPEGEPPSFLATLMMSSLGPAPSPTADAYLNFLHSWKRRGGRTSPPLTPRAPVIVSPPQLPAGAPPPFCQYLNQFKNLPDPSLLGNAPPLTPGLAPPSQGSGSSNIDSEDEMYMTRILATVPPPEQLIDRHPPAPTSSSPSMVKCRKKRWMDRLNGLTPSNNHAPSPDHVIVTGQPPGDHVDENVRNDAGPASRDEEMTSPSVVRVKEEGEPTPLNFTKAPNGVIKRAVKLKKNNEQPPAADQYNFDHKAPKTYQITVNGLTVDITDYPLLSTTPVT